jgi:hypothetical protein
MHTRLIALAIIAVGLTILSHPVQASVDPPQLKICAADIDGDQKADSFCMGYDGCLINSTGC